MKRAILAAFLMAVVSSSTGCCLLDAIFCGGGCWGCGGCGGCGGGCGGCYDEGYSCDDGCGCDGGCGGGGGYYGGGGGGGGCATCGYAQHGPRMMANGPEYGYAQGPPSAGVTYPYYTNRGPRDFLAQRPRSIGP
ncbi:MAG: hypothetical protein K1X74_03150 [Pirellulales bacterium]|nr:hypothetical protein [Pirellulales bacterium]